MNKQIYKLVTGAVFAPTTKLFYMALIKCPECGDEVSDMAEACPKCARPINAQKQTSSTGRIAAFLLGLIFLGTFLIGFHLIPPIASLILGIILIIGSLLSK